MSSFRQYGGLNRAATNNIVRNHYSNSDNPTISNYLGQWNSKIVSESHLDLSGNSILNVNGIYFDNGTTIIDGSFNGDLTVNGNLEVTKNTQLDGSLNVFGVSNFYNQLFVNGYDATINTLTVGLGSGGISSNTALGYQTLYSNTTGSTNTAVGYSSMYSNNSGYLNTALGFQSLQSNTVGILNTALGAATLFTNTRANANTAVGLLALTEFNGILNSDGNTAVGAQAFQSKTFGEYNTAVGCRSGEGNETINDNFYDGSGSYNTYLGARTGVYPQYSTYEYSTAIGYGATISSSHQIKIGTELEQVVCPGDVSLNSTLEVGGDATFYSTVNGIYINNGSNDNNNILLTTSKLNSISGIYNTVVGTNSMADATTAGTNSCFGFSSGAGLDTGSGNTFIGSGAGEHTINGNGNTFVGYNSGNYVDGSYNTVLGYLAWAYNDPYNYTTVIGYNAQPTDDHQIVLGTVEETVIIDGSLNVFGDVSLNSTLEVRGAATFDASMVVYGDVSLNSTLEVGGVATFDAQIVANADVSLNSTLEVGGASTFYSTVNGIYINNGKPLSLYNIILNTSLVPKLTGSNNTMLGYNIMPSATSAGTSCCVGYQAGHGITTSQSNTLIGAEAGYAISDGSFNTAIGYHAYISGNYGYSTAIGAFSVPTGDHQIVLGTVKETVIIDGSLNVAGTTKSLYFVSGSDYRIKTDVKSLDNTFKIDQLNPVTYTNKLSGKQDTGFIAHEVEEIFPHLVTGEKDGEETQTLNYQGLIAILTREIQELKKRVEILENK
jgi:hypothetical protein